MGSTEKWITKMTSLVWKGKRISENRNWHLEWSNLIAQFYRKISNQC
jgi:hypothetical protein